jgi:hypothetical protein
VSSVWFAAVANGLDLIDCNLHNGRSESFAHFLSWLMGVPTDWICNDPLVDDLRRKVRDIKEGSRTADLP